MVVNSIALIVAYRRVVAVYFLLLHMSTYKLNRVKGGEIDGTQHRLGRDQSGNQAHKAGWSQTKTGAVLGKSQSYASLRLKGLASWTTDDLDKLAKALGYGNAFALLDIVRGMNR